MLFIFPTEVEAAPFRSACPHAQIIICGVGIAECAATVAELAPTIEPSEVVVLAGVAGSYSLSDVAMCEVVEVVSERIEALPERFAKTYSIEPLTTLRHVVSNTVNSSAEIMSPAAAQIENMEGAALFALCNRLEIRCTQIRAISNKVGDPFPTWQLPEACSALGAACSELLEIACGASS